MVLYATEHFEDLEAFVTAIHETISRWTATHFDTPDDPSSVVPLMGCSATRVFADGRCYARGAGLAVVSSDFCVSAGVGVGVGLDAFTSVQAAVDQAWSQATVSGPEDPGGVILLACPGWENALDQPPRYVDHDIVEEVKARSACGR